MELAEKQLSFLTNRLGSPDLDLEERLNIHDKIYFLNKTTIQAIDKEKGGREMLVSHDCSSAGSTVKYISFYN